MPDIIPEPKKPGVQPRPGDLILQGFIKRNPFLIVDTIADYGRKKIGDELSALLTGGGAGADKLPGDAIVPKKILEEIGQYFLPGRFPKAITELGEGEIPFTSKAQRKPGLGVGEEVAAQLIAEEYRRRAAGERAADVDVVRANALVGYLVSVGALASTAPELPPPLVARGPAGSAPAVQAILNGQAILNETAQLAGAQTPADPASLLQQLALTLARGPVRNLATERTDP